MLIGSPTEKVIEDIFVQNKTIIAEILEVKEGDLSLVVRQKIFDDNKRLDLLYLHESELILVELKVVPFYEDIINQINHYEKELVKLQDKNKLIKTKINKIILVTQAKIEDYKKCLNENIKLIEFDIKSVLSKYFEVLPFVAKLLEIQPANLGVVRLSLFKTTLNLLAEGKTITQIADIEGKVINTIKNRLKLAKEVGLVNKFKETFYLSELGIKFLGEDDKMIEDKFSEKQIETLSDWIMKNPFISQINLSIFAVIETVFILSRTAYPVEYVDFQEFFIKLLGKTHTWKQDRAKETGTYHFYNYASEMQFISRVNNSLYLTPKGIQAILLLQLNRSIQIIESQAK